MATIVATAAGGDWNIASTWVGGVVPTNADDVLLDASSGNVRVATASGNVARSLDCTGYAGTLTWLGGCVLAIGNASGGLVKLVATMATVIGSTTSRLDLVSTSDNGGAGWGITTAGKTVPAVTFNGTGGKWVLQDALSTFAGATLTVTAGSFITNGMTPTAGSFSSSNSNVRTIDITNSTVNVTGGTWTFTTTTNLTFVSVGSTINLGPTNGSFSGGQVNYNDIVINGWVATQTIQQGSGNPTIANLTCIGGANKVVSLMLGSSITVTGTVTLTGNSITNRLLVFSNVLGTTRTLTVNGSVVASNVDLQDIAGAGSASWDLSAIAGGSGDAGGNSGITFTPSVTQTATGTASFTWSTHGWTTRVPLPQDDVVINNAFVAGQTITIDMPRAGRNLDMSGVSGNPSLVQSVAESVFYGSVALGSDMTITGTNTTRFSGRGSHTFTSAGRSFAGTVSIGGPGGTYALQDAFATAGNLAINDGTFTTNDHSVTVLNFTANSGRTAVLNLGTSTIALTVAGASSSMWNTNNLFTTVNGASATLIVVNPTTSTRGIVLRGVAQSTIGTITYTVAASTGVLFINAGGGQAPEIGTLNIGDGRTLQLVAGNTTSITNAFNVNGTAGNLTSIVSSTPGTQATLSMASGTVTARYVSIQDSNATGGAYWLAVDAVDGGNNTGWFFETLPIAGNRATETDSALAGAPQVWVTGTRAIETDSAFTGTISARAIVLVGSVVPSDVVGEPRIVFPASPVPDSRILVRLVPRETPTTPAQLLANSYGRSWLDELDGLGTGELALQADDPDVAAVDYFDLLWFELDGDVRFAARVEGKQYLAVTEGEEAEQTVKISGRSSASIFEDAVVYPDDIAFAGVSNQSDRVFNFASPEFDDSGWAPAVVTPSSNYGKPVGWPDKTAEWIWDRDSSSFGVPEGNCYFRSTFTSLEGDHEVWAAADDAYEVWVDGVRMFEDGFELAYVGQAMRQRVALAAGAHTIGVWARNMNTLKAGLRVAVMTLNDKGVPDDVVHHTTAAWKVVGYPPEPPGFTPGAIVRVLVEEAQARGALSGVTLGFTDVADSNGNAWLSNADMAFTVGLDLASALLQMAETYADFWLGPDMVLRLYGDRGTTTSASLAPAVNIVSLEHEGRV